MLKPYELENYVTISANYQKTEIKSFIFMYDFFVTLILIAYQHTIKRIFIFLAVHIHHIHMLKYGHIVFGRWFSNFSTF